MRDTRQVRSDHPAARFEPSEVKPWVIDKSSESGEVREQNPEKRIERVRAELLVAHPDGHALRFLTPRPFDQGNAPSRRRGRPADQGHEANVQNHYHIEVTAEGHLLV